MACRWRKKHINTPTVVNTRFMEDMLCHESNTLPVQSIIQLNVLTDTLYIKYVFKI
jgi:hypothetical protein